MDEASDYVIYSIILSHMGLQIKSGYNKNLTLNILLKMKMRQTAPPTTQPKVLSCWLEQQNKLYTLTRSHTSRLS